MVKEKRQKYPQKERLPPKEFDIEYQFLRGFSGNSEEQHFIKFDGKDKSKIIYFKVILRRKYKGKFRTVAVFDSYHKNKSYTHGHRQVGISRKRENIDTPSFKSLKEGKVWVGQHLSKKWNYYVSMFYKDIRSFQRKKRVKK